MQGLSQKLHLELAQQVKRQLEYLREMLPRVDRRFVDLVEIIVAFSTLGSNFKMQQRYQIQVHLLIYLVLSQRRVIWIFQLQEIQIREQIRTQIQKLLQASSLFNVKALDITAPIGHLTLQMWARFQVLWITHQQKSLKQQSSSNNCNCRLKRLLRGIQGRLTYKNQ